MPRPEVEQKKTRQRPRKIKPVKWPGEDRQVGLMLLNCDELQTSHIEAKKHLDRKGLIIDGFSSEALVQEEQIQRIYRMILEEETTRPEDRVFVNASEVRKEFTPAEREYFDDQHSAFLLETIKEWNLDEEQPEEEE